MIKRLRLLLFSVLINIAGFGQVSSYTFTAFSGTYTDLSGGTVAPLIEDFISTYPGDDGYANGLPIGFSFVYSGISYTTISLSTNGWLTFGQNISNAAISNSLTSGGTRPLVAPLWDDIGVASANDITYATSGSAPDRIMTVQWNNVKWSFTSSNTPCIAFQVKLYETLNRIEFIYKQLPGNVSTTGASIGITGTAVGSGNYISLNSSNASPSVSSTAEVTNINVRPATDQVYQFNPPPLCSNLTLPYQQGFNTNTAGLFTCWSKIVVAAGAVAPDLIVVSAGTTPVSSPAESTGMLRFNSANASSGTRIRASAPPFITTGVANVDVSFSMFENNSSAPAANNDFVILQYSINSGLTWINADTNYRYNQNLASNGSGNRWYKRHFTLPPNAGNRADLRIALLFISAAGNDIYIDDFNVNASVPIINSGNCSDVITITNVCGQNRFRVIGSNGGPVVELRPNNNNLGTATVKYYVNTSPLRKDNQNIYYLDRNYEIKTTIPPFTPTGVKFYFTTAELTALQTINSQANLSNLMATRVDGSPGDQCSLAFMNTNANSKVLPTSVYGDYVNGHYIILNPAGFSQFFIYEDPANRVLPPTELIFTAVPKNGIHVLQWQPLIEQGVSYYRIERSGNGRDWVDLALVSSLNYAGSTYYSKDVSPLDGNNYYRIVQVSANGKERFSIVKMIDNIKDEIKVYPSPVHEQINVSFSVKERATYKIRIMDASGKVAYEDLQVFTPGVKNKQIHLNSMPQGLYLISLISGNSIHIRKFIKM